MPSTRARIGLLIQGPRKGRDELVPYGLVSDTDHKDLEPCRPLLTQPWEHTLCTNIGLHTSRSSRYLVVCEAFTHRKLFSQVFALLVLGRRLLIPSLVRANQAFSLAILLKLSFMLSVIVSFYIRHLEQCGDSLVHSSLPRSPAGLRSQQALFLLNLSQNSSGALRKLLPLQRARAL